MEPKFVDQLPPRAGVGIPYPEIREFGEALRANPGRWAEYKRWPKDKRNTAHSGAYQIKSGKYASLGSGFEAAARTVGDEIIVFVRFVGESS